MKKLLGVAVLLLGCGTDATDPPIDRGPPVQLAVLGTGRVNERITSEVAVLGNVVYTGTWGCRGSVCGNAIKIWDASGATPVLIDSLITQRGATVGDVQVSDDGRLLAAAIEHYPNGGLELFDLSNPRKPVFITRLTSSDIEGGVHTVKLGRVNNRHYAFLSIDPSPNGRARLVIADITVPAQPAVVHVSIMGTPYVHDVFVRDGILMTALWDDGMTIWDIGGAGAGGTMSAPVQLGNVKTVGGDVHNIAWVHDPRSGSKRYAFIGQESPYVNGRPTGDIHVVDVSNLRAPREVAFFRVDSAGVHNFAVDEPSGILYAAYYNAGVRALDVRGDLGSCSSDQKAADGRCNLSLMKRERGRALTDRSVSVWGVALNGNNLYASDMVAGVHKIDISPLKR